MLNEQIVRKISEGEPEWMIDKRLKAFNKFKELEMPSFKYGIGIFVDVSKLNLKEINPLGNLDGSLVVGSDKIEVMSFREALEKYEDVIKKTPITRWISPITASNTKK